MNHQDLYQITQNILFRSNIKYKKYGKVYSLISRIRFFIFFPASGKPTHDGNLLLKLNSAPWDVVVTRFHYTHMSSVFLLILLRSTLFDEGLVFKFISFATQKVLNAVHAVPFYDIPAARSGNFKQSVFFHYHHTVERRLNGRFWTHFRNFKLAYFHW